MKQMKIIKRSGEEKPFEVKKIETAIRKANGDVDGKDALSEGRIRLIVDEVQSVCESRDRAMTVEEIQDVVEDKLMELGSADIAKKYITYRYKRSLRRKTNTTDAELLSLINGTNEDIKQENSNKNPKVLSVQRDYMAGAVSKDLCRRYLYPKDVMEAHDEGAIHIHDLDYVISNISNCFSGNTRFITDRGIRRFQDFQDGSPVVVKDKDGVLRRATVHKYGLQRMQKVTIKNPKMTETIVCTRDHRWILADGSVTTSLKIGDQLYRTKNSFKYDVPPEDIDERRAWCMGFCIGDGSDTVNTRGSSVRLCGEKNKYIYAFKSIGCSANFRSDCDGDAVMYFSWFKKQDFLNGKSWKVLPAKLQAALFCGYYAADGHKKKNLVCTADDRVAEMIYDTAGMAGCYITSSKEDIRDTPFKEHARLIRFQFSTGIAANWTWRVVDIKPVAGEPQHAWCVEEPVTHTFTLDKGIITGNCELINLEDMLQNGTVISGNTIDRPKSFLTACTIATQISAQVASHTFGGQTISLAHLAPFIDVSRQKIRKELEAELGGVKLSDKKMSEIVEARVRREVKSGVQTIQYQVSTIMCSNGQAPFISVMMYLGEAKNEQEKKDLALLIEEVLNQRIQGVKNEVGVYVTPAFPKLLYVLTSENCTEGTPYWYLTELAAKCTAKRMVPDYISEKKMLEYKIDGKGRGNVYPCMGCVTGDEVITYKVHGELRVCSFERMWSDLAPYYEVKVQPGRQKDLYIDLYDVEIYDNVNGWTECKRIIRNSDCKVLNVKLSNGRCIQCTPDHPFETENRGVVHAQDLKEDDVVKVDKSCSFNQGSQEVHYDEKLAWLYGFLLCDSSYAGHLTASIAATSEDDIGARLKGIVKEKFGLEVREVLQHRERKGTYKDLTVLSAGNEEAVKLSCRLVSMFGGIKKCDRKIPSEVFSWDREARLAFLAGIIDADGYINSTCSSVTMVEVGSTNKELAIEEMYLAQSLGMRGSVYQNKYKGIGRADTVRYLVMFEATEELVDAIACRKKTAHFAKSERSNRSISLTDYASPVSISEIDGVHYTYDVTTASEHFTVSGIYSHNCRAFLTPDSTGDGYGNVARAKNYVPGESKYYGRFNMGACTLNLPYVALTAEHNLDTFWKNLDHYAELCHKAQQVRAGRLKGALSDVAPILWQHGAMARLNKGEKIDALLYKGYATISLGYAGLWECVFALIGKKLTEPEGEKLGLEIMQKLNEYTAKWKKAENMDYSLYGTPLESTTYKFAKSLQKRFGIVSGVSDRNYITNSYHVHVTEPIDAFKKLELEAKFQKLSPGGAISYVEVPNMQNNLPAVLSIMKFIYDNIMYAELNTKSDYCQVCGFDGEIQIVKDESGKLIWKCPKCGNTDESKLNVTRRTCGYLGSQFWNQGRTQEIKERVIHVS